MNKVISIEQKEDKNGNAMKVVTFEGADKKVYVNSKYDSDNYDKVVEGAEFELEVDGNFLKIAGGKKVGGSKSGMISKAQDTKRADIKDAQGNKQDGIKIASTFRDATLITLETFKDAPFDVTIFQDRWNHWRAWLWEQYDKPLDRKWIEDNTDAL